jgi:vacuolar-type H+-ATPase subunit H
LNEKRIQDVIEIEKQADEIYQKAVIEAARIPQLAETEAKKIVEKARQDAETEARQLIAEASVKEQTDRILAETEEKIQHNQKMAKNHFEHATSYVISRILGQK